MRGIDHAEALPVAAVRALETQEGRAIVKTRKIEHERTLRFAELAAADVGCFLCTIQRRSRAICCGVHVVRVFGLESCERLEMLDVLLHKDTCGGVEEIHWTVSFRRGDTASSHRLVKSTPRAPRGKRLELLGGIL